MEWCSAFIVKRNDSQRFTIPEPPDSLRSCYNPQRINELWLGGANDNI